MTKQKYTVRILDNFHFMDTSEEYNSGICSTYNEAVDKCKKIIDDFLESALTANDTADSLYMTWVQYGENPKIDGDNLGNFSTKKYVEEKCKNIIADSR